MAPRLKVVVCGGGNAAHVLVPVIKRASGAWVGVLVPYGDEAARLTAGASLGGIAATSRGGGFTAAPDAVSALPEDVVPRADIVLLSVPAFAHDAMVDMVSPFLKEGAWLGAMPSRSGFEFYGARPDLRAKGVTLFGYQTLPWACRILEYGRRVAVLGTKAVVGVGASPAERAPEVASVMEQLTGIRTRPVESMLSVSLGNVGQVIHPGIMYGLFRRAEAAEYDESSIPMFYGGVTDETAALLDAMSDEVLSVAAALRRMSGGRLTLREVVSLKQWLLDSYGAQIRDPATTRSCFVTNSAYEGLKAPVVRAGEKYRPDFKSRYITEDVPYGLVVTRGIADMCGVPVPTIDEVMTATSQWAGAEYYTDGRPEGRDIRASRHPANFGIRNVETLLERAL